MGNTKIDFSPIEHTPLTFIDIGVVLLAGIGIPLARSNVARLALFTGVPFTYELVFVLVMGAAAAYIGYRFRFAQRAGLLTCIYVLLPFGIGAEATIHVGLNQFTFDRNTLPLDILYFLILALLPLTLGTAVGRHIARLGRRRERRNALA